MYNRTKEAYQGTKYENNFFFYHDALFLMMSAKNRRWMAEQGILKHQILPENGLNANIKGYKERIPGNQPELNALDSNCNQDVHSAANKHVTFTATAKKDDPWKFSLSTPKEMDRTYLQLFDPDLQVKFGWEPGIPSSKRIVEDMNQIFDYTALKIFSARGVVIRGCGSHRGRRDDGTAQVGRRGGRMTKKKKAIGCIHPDAKAVLNKEVAASRARWEGTAGIPDTAVNSEGEIDSDDVDASESMV